MTVTIGQFEAEAPPPVGEEALDTKVVGRSPWKIAKSRFRRDKVSMTAFVIVLIYAAMAVLAPILDKLGVIDPQSFHGKLVGGIGSVPIGAHGGISSSHLLGVEPQTGRDLLSRLVLGVTLSMAVAVAATAFSIIVGTVLGIISGYLGGWADFWIGRFIDLVLSFPQLLMLLALSPVLIDRIVAIGIPRGNPAQYAYLVFVLGFFGFPYFARIIRGQTLSLREREFVEASRSLGAPNRRIWFKELLPNLWAPILVYTTLTLPANISAEAALSFLGVGIKAPTPTLGNILNDSVNYLSADPIYFFLPGMFIFIVVLSFNLLGDGLRDALDPKSH
jgi:peptide/nickel transport system permease protein